MTANLLKLRPYQADANADIYQAWDDGAINVLAVLPTGGGKTVCFSDILHDHRGPSCAIAHRQVTALLRVVKHQALLEVLTRGDEFTQIVQGGPQRLVGGKT